MHFNARARILEGRHAIYTGKAPVVASYSSRGPDVNNALLQTADVLKPNIMAPGSSIWAAWSPNDEGDPYNKGITDPNFHLMLKTIYIFRIGQQRYNSILFYWPTFNNTFERYDSSKEHKLLCF